MSESHPARTGTAAGLPPAAYVGLAFLAYNMAIGMGFGVYGTMVETLERQFSTSRTLASSGISLMALALGLLAPMVDRAARRWGLSRTMLTGAALCALGYAAAAMAHDIYLLLAAFAVLIGPGACLLGPIPASMLVTFWVPEAKRGRALGIANMPVFIFIFPFITSWLLRQIGVSGIFLMLAGLMLAIMPLLRLVRDKPVATETPGVLDGGAAPGSLEIFRRPAFLVIALGSSLITAAGMTMVSHLVSIGLDRGLRLDEASVMLSVFGISGAGGAVLFGLLADRASPRVALAVSALVPIFPLLGLGYFHTFLPLIVSAGVMGLCTSAIPALQSMAVASWLGQRVFGRAMGVLYLFQVPFLFGAAPLAGFLVDRTGSYQPALLLNILTLGLTGVMFLLYSPARVKGAQTYGY